ncbi:D-alanyl-D-alanine carboxypeptidase family protein, partial [Kribbia dieselivorans]|uniref:D-alanyl-D-alanine carboxypeptidase family protein n=1 Tax=Kribbia dieselivorans TaxID=331526 RepID=UPI000838A710
MSRYDALGGPKMAAHGVVKDARATTPPAVRNVSWLIADLDSGEVLAAKAPHAKLRPASTLKTLTALTLIPQISPKSSHRITDADSQAEGTRVGLVPGARYTGDELFNALLLSSGNDAAYALARVGGGRDTVLREMNAQARRLGAWDTHAADPAGLDAPAQYSSAYDLALIGREAMKNTRFRTYVARKNATLPGVKRGATRTRFEISNHNAVLYNYPGAIGVKNGYTTKANHTLISAVRRNGRTLIITQMYGLQGGWRPTAALYDWAFANIDRLSPVGHLVSPAEAQRIAASRTTSRERSRTTEPTPRATAQPTASAAPVATP